MSEDVEPGDGWLRCRPGREGEGWKGCSFKLTPVTPSKRC